MIRVRLARPGQPGGARDPGRVRGAILSSTLWLPDDDRPLTDTDAMRERLGQVDLIIDGGNCGHEPTTVLDLVGGTPLVVRRGKGDVSAFQQ